MVEGVLRLLRLFVELVIDTESNGFRNFLGLLRLHWIGILETIEAKVVLMRLLRI